MGNNTPIEFTADHVAQQSGDQAFTPYRPFLKSGEPYRSLLENNPWLLPPDMSKPLPPRGSGGYWDTTVARKHDHWKDKDLPTATKDINRLRHDLYEWGFCLIEDGLSADQLETIKSRTHEQAQAEELAGVSQKAPFLNLIWTLVNKGDCFVKCLELDPDGVQAGPLVEQLLDETLGAGWCHYSFLSNIAWAGCYPQFLHQDQGAIHPWMTAEAPILVNVVYILDDVNEDNGGTLMIPGSHKALSAAGNGGKVGKLPPAINTEAKAGTIMLMDGRVLHGTGVNRTDKPRYILTNSCVKSWLKTQENWTLNMAPDVLAKASDKLLQRTSFQARVNENLVDGFGSGGSGKPGDAVGDIRPFRQAYDDGNFHRVRALTPDDVKGWNGPPWTVQTAWAELKARINRAKRPAKP